MYLLGLEVGYIYDGFFFSQSKYAKDVMSRVDLLHSKPVPTPLATHETFTPDGPLFSGLTLYRSLVGALQYLTITRPDLLCAINHASLYLHAPTDAYFPSVKWILRYVKDAHRWLKGSQLMEYWKTGQR
ncbi:unnamed protein product [Lactuca saligna]|uniref:Reverse transcriptase Ty1/copia-type domain-containing protein n=1 Tax=Lactuca saligna TaxID=75948 RepID=A0AA35ZGG3_LACSI|nr:unnamed protein product [Lactuca saligna]